jgi:alkylation response protein AidB-like acyl-CoA dehydrogenase
MPTYIEYYLELIIELGITIPRRRQQMDFGETDQQKAVKEIVRGLTRKYNNVYYLEKARSGEKMDELWRELGKAGLLGVCAGPEYGGSELGISELAIVCKEFASAGCPVLMLIVSAAICTSIIYKTGTEEQKRRWIPALSSGEQKMAFAITEPEAGSNTHNISTRAIKVEGGYLLNGSKYYISGVDESQNVLVVAKVGHDEGEKAKFGLFVVPTDAQGLTKNVIPVDIVSPEKQFFLYFDNVLVDESNLIGMTPGELETVFLGLNPERITAAAISCGLGEYALKRAVDYAKERKVWQVPIGGHQAVSHPLAEAYLRLSLAWLMTQKAAWYYDRGNVAGEFANLAKVAAADAALFALDHAIQTHGGNGFASEYGLASMWGITRLLKSAPVSREMALNYITLHILGLPKSY